MLKGKAKIRPGYCEENARLVEEFVESVRILMDLHGQQVQAVLNRDPEFARFDMLIHAARERKDEVKYSIISHQELHGCSAPSPVDLFRAFGK